MFFNEVFRNLQQLWDNKPGAVVLLVVGFVVFVFLVVDTWRHKNRHKGR
jgi:hypothetical protein